MKISTCHPRGARVAVARVTVAVCAVFALASCGSSAGPEALTLVSGGNGMAKNAAGSMDAAPSADMRLGVWNVTYKVSGTLPDLGSSALAWKLGKVSRTDALGAAVKIAAELGIEGSPVQAPGDKSSYSIGFAPKTDSGPKVPSGTGMWVYLGSPREASWSYYSEANMAIAVSRSCEKSSDGTEKCSEPTPPVMPKNLPSKADATARAREVITASGGDPSGFHFVATKDDWGTFVQATQKFGDLESYYSSWFSFGEDGAIVSASGSILNPVKGDEYPLIPPAQAVDRLATPMYGVPLYGMAKGGVATGGAAVDSAVAPGDTTSGGDAPDSTDAKPVDSVPVDSIPEPEPTVITITDARLSLLPAYLADGRVILLPAYTFSNTDGDVGTVFAVEDKYISFETSTPQSGDEPKPIEPGVDQGSGSTGSGSGSAGSGGGSVGSGGVVGSGGAAPDVPAGTIRGTDAEKLVGLTEDEAIKVAEGFGWAVRVSERDGEQMMLTQDYRMDRVNLAVTKGVVSGVTIG